MTTRTQLRRATNEKLIAAALAYVACIEDDDGEDEADTDLARVARSARRDLVDAAAKFRTVWFGEQVPC
jgi:hypothetical protein